MCWIEDHKTELCFMLHFIFVRLISRFWLYKGLTISDWQCMTDWQSWMSIGLKSVMVIVLWVQFPLGAKLFFAEIKTVQCKYCTEMYEKCKRKTSIVQFTFWDDWNVLREQDLFLTVCKTIEFVSMFRQNCLNDLFVYQILAKVVKLCIEIYMTFCLTIELSANNMI